MSVIGMTMEFYVGGSPTDGLVFRRMRTAFERAGMETARLGRWLFPGITLIDKSNFHCLAGFGLDLFGQLCDLCPILLTCGGD